jgi:hypothetical protein
MAMTHKCGFTGHLSYECKDYPREITKTRSSVLCKLTDPSFLTDMLISILAYLSAFAAFRLGFRAWSLHVALEKGTYRYISFAGLRSDGFVWPASRMIITTLTARTLQDFGTPATSRHLALLRSFMSQQYLQRYARVCRVLACNFHGKCSRLASTGSCRAWAPCTSLSQALALRRLRCLF